MDLMGFQCDRTPPTTIVMAKRTKQSIAFSQWVRHNRIALGKSQKELGNDIVSQQDWSRIERQGAVPSDDILHELCRVLRRPVQEAQRIIEESATTDERARMFELDFNAFEESLVAGALAAAEAEPLQVFVIREDAERSDEATLAKHYRILTIDGHIQLTILFRYSDPRIWRSFLALAAPLAARWRDEDRDLRLLQGKLKGYYRHESQEEKQGIALPLIHPLVLVSDFAGPRLYYYDFDSKILEGLRATGIREEDALPRSIALLQGMRPMADLVAGWIGLQGPFGLPEDLWVPIPWPELAKKQKELGN
jgi:transcriptional regulator with XRE-family HTH domain